MAGPVASSPELVGREEELVDLRARLDQACVGAGGVVLLVGEPGIGKTRLAEELAADARLRGTRVLWGRCYEGEGAPAFWPWLQVLRACVRDFEPEALRVDLGPAASDIAQLVPEIRLRLPGLPEPPSLEPAQARFRLFDALSTFLKTAAERHPLLLVLDDLHWADRPSLLALEFLAGELRGSRLLVLGTYRDLEVGPQHPLAQTLAKLTREPTCQRILLRGLAERDVARFIALAAGLEPPAALVAAVHRETEGNPLFVAEVVRLLRAEGRLEGAGWGSSWQFSIPQGVREVIGQRLERLSARCQRVLTVAAVIGRDFGLAALQPASGLRPEAILELLEEAEAARVIVALPRALGRYSFGHALVRETLYDELPTARRARVHRRVGEAMEALYAHDLEPHLAELAHHFLRAALAGDPTRAVAYARRAAVQTLAILGYEAAADLYERALQAAELQGSRSLRDQCELLLALGSTRRKAGEPDEALEAFERAAALARRLDAPTLFAGAALGFEETVLATGMDRAGIGQPSVALLEQALEALGPEPSAERARVLAALGPAMLFTGSRERAIALSRQAAELARLTGDRSVRVYSLNARRIVMWGPDHPEERLAVVSELVRLADESGDPEMALDGHQWRHFALLELGDLEGAAAEVEAYARLAERLRQPLYRCYVPLLRGNRALLEGRFEEAERLAEQALALAQRAQSQNAAQVYVAHMRSLRREQGRVGELEAAIRGYAEQFPSSWTWRSVLTLVACELGQRDEAQLAFEQLAARDFADLPRSYVWLLNVAILSEICAYLGDARRASALYGLLLPYASRNVVGSSAGPCWGSASHYLGLLATTLRRWDEAARHFDTALDSHARLGAQPWLAHTQHHYARMLLAHGQPGNVGRARELLAAASSTARALGMARLAKEVADLQASESPAGPSPAYPDGLTEREVEVLRRIAAGRTTREIAAELVVSIATVERHITNLYTKTGARGRADATAYALGHGLARPQAR